MIEIEKVVFNYEEEIVLNNVSFKLEPSHIYGLVGANGSGKTTLLNVLSGALLPNKGDVKYNGKSISVNNDYLSNMILLNELYYKGNLNSNAMVKLMAKIKGRTICWKTFNYLFPLLKINPQTKLKNLSKGMAQTVMIIVSLSIKLEIIFLDEFFDGIDIVNRRYLKDYIIEYVISNNAIILVTSHSMDDIKDLCDRILILKNKQLIVNEDLDEYQYRSKTYQIVSNCNLDYNYFKELKLTIKGYKSFNNIHWLLLDDSDELNQLYQDDKIKDIRLIKSKLEDIIYYEISN